jgi:hypothetical protein
MFCSVLWPGAGLADPVSLGHSDGRLPHGS